MPQSGSQCFCVMFVENPHEKSVIAANGVCGLTVHSFPGKFTVTTLLALSHDLWFGAEPRA